MLTIWAWSTLASFGEPLFVIASLIFVVGVVIIGRRTTRLSSAAEFGVFFGYIYGVAVWGSLGYYFDFSSYVKMLLAGAVILDAAYLTIIARLVFDRLERAGIAARAAELEARELKGA